MSENRIYVNTNDNFTFAILMTSEPDRYITVNMNMFIDEPVRLLINAMTDGFQHLQNTNVSYSQLECIISLVISKFLFYPNDTVTREHIRYHSNTLCIALKRELENEKISYNVYECSRYSSTSN